MSQSETAERVLLIDDDEVFVRVLARALGARGLRVATAGNRAAALTAARELRPEYVVLDLKLGDDNGLALIPELLELDADVRILLLTGYASIATAVEAIKRGAWDYLAKPVDADQVVQAMRSSRARGGRAVGTGVRDAAAQAPGVGAHSAHARRVRRQYFRSGAAARHASSHAAAQAIETSGARSGKQLTAWRRTHRQR